MSNADINKDEQLRLHNKIDPHTHASRLSEVILGGQDGLVNVLGVILGMAAPARAGSKWRSSAP